MRLVGLPSLHPVATLFVGLFALHCVLNLKLLLPLPSEVDAIDYPRFIRAGEGIMTGLAEGQPYIPKHGGYPVAPLLYAVISAPFLNSLDWLMLTGWAGRIVFSTGLWLVAYLVARRMPLQPYTSVAAGGLLFWSPVFYFMLSGIPYSLFPFLAGVGLWQVLGFLKTGRLRHLSVASAALGLASLTHTDGVLLFGILIASAALVITARHRLALATWTARFRLVAALSVPWTAVVGLYLVSFFLVNGTWDVGIREQMAASYKYFEWGPAGVSNGTIGLAAATAESRRLYGAPEENGHSVLRAVLRNPGAALQRMLRSALRFPPVFAETYGGPLGAGYLLLAGVGLTYLLRRHRLLAVLLLLWSSYAARYLLFYIHGTFAGFHYAVVISLAGAGLAWLGSLVANSARFSGAAAKGVIIVTGALLVVALIAVRYQDASIRLPELGHTSEDRVARYLLETQPRDTMIASAGSLTPYMAKMDWTFLPWFVLDGGTVDQEAFSRWLRANKVALLYVSPLLETLTPQLYAFIDSEMPLEDILSFREEAADRLALCEQHGLKCVHRLLRVRSQ